MTATLWPKDHPGRHCRVCAMCVYPIWIGDEPPPGDCPHRKTDPRACPDVMSRIEMGVFVGAATGRPTPHTDMLIAACRMTREEAEALCDKNGRGSHTIAELKAMPKPWLDKEDGGTHERGE